MKFKSLNHSAYTDPEGDPSAITKHKNKPLLYHVILGSTIASKKRAISGSTIFSPGTYTK